MLDEAITDTFSSSLIGTQNQIEPKANNTTRRMSPSVPTHEEMQPTSFVEHPDGLHHRRRAKQAHPRMSPESILATEIKALKSHIHPPVPNPAPLGLIAFGLTTALLQMKHTRIAGDSQDDLNGVDPVVMGFAVFFGGLLQIIAGLSEIKRNNVFGYTAFCLYGGFWMSVGTTEIVSLLATGGIPWVNPKASQAMLFMVGLFTFMLWVLTFKMNKTICSLFFLLGSTLMLLTFGVENKTADQVGGYFGLSTAANAFWLAFAELVNDVIGEGTEVIPLGHWNWNSNKTKANNGGAHAPGRIQGSRPSAVIGSILEGSGAAHAPGLIQRADPATAFGNESEQDGIQDVETGITSGATSETE